MSIHNNMATRKDTKYLMNIHSFIKTAKVTTTSEIAEKMHLSWNTAEKRLLELALEGKVERIKKAGVNLWVPK